jgi:hypothetical protein
VVLRVMKKEELRHVDGSDSLHPNRSGDVVVVFRPPYQTDAQTPGQLVAPSQFFGQHGYLPDLVNLNRNINMHGTFIAAGPGIERLRIRPRRPCDRRGPDAAPDGHPRAAERTGRDPVPPPQGRRCTPRGHHPRHQRLARPVDVERGHDTLAAANSASAVGGAASSRRGSTPTVRGRAATID